MDLFKSKNIKLATSLDWNAKCCKRKKGDTQKLHKCTRRILKKDLKLSIDNYINL